MKITYSIGEFSQVTGLSVKTLRFYHERGILIPSSVDDATGYRFYDAAKVEKARVIDWAAVTRRFCSRRTSGN
jgi:DNA-binding transcriptional MerR regulator